MKPRQLLMLSLVMFALGILCQLYSMFSVVEPYIQQLSFMFVAMPSVIAIINHQYHIQENVCEENTAFIRLPARNTPKNAEPHVSAVAATS